MCAHLLLAQEGARLNPADPDPDEARPVHALGFVMTLIALVAVCWMTLAALAVTGAIGTLTAVIIGIGGYVAAAALVFVTADQPSLEFGRVAVLPAAVAFASLAAVTAQRNRILPVAGWAAFGAAVAVALDNTIIGVVIVAAIAGLLAFWRVRGSAGQSRR